MSEYDHVFLHWFAASLGAGHGIALALMTYGGIREVARFVYKRDKAKGAATTAPNNETTEKQTNG